MFVEIMEAISVATFLSREEKQPWVRLAIRKIDTLKVLLMVLWETRSIDDKKYITLSEKIEEIGRMLGGWNGQLSKKLPRLKDEGEMKRVAETGKPPVVVPIIVVLVDIHVTLVVPTVERGIALYGVSSTSLPLEYSQGCIESGIVMP